MRHRAPRCALTGRVRRWRGVCRVRCDPLQLSRRHSVRLPWIRFHPLPSELYVRISRIQLSSAIMHLAHGTPVWSSFQPCQSPAVPGDGATRLPEVARLHPRCPSRTRRQACSRPDSTRLPFGRPDPFTYACDASGLSALHAGFLGSRHSRRPSPVRHPSTPEAPFLDGHYPASPVIRASPPPRRPGLPLTGFQLPRARHQRGFPCCHTPPLPCVPTLLPRRKRDRCIRRSLPGPSAAFP